MASPEQKNLKHRWIRKKRTNRTKNFKTFVPINVYPQFWEDTLDQLDTLVFETWLST